MYTMIREVMTTMSTETHVIKRIEMMQKELEDLKNKVLKKGSSEIVSLRGIWEGVDFPDEEIEEAKHSWLKEFNGGKN